MLVFRRCWLSSDSLGPHTGHCHLQAQSPHLGSGRAGIFLLELSLTLQRESDQFSLRKCLKHLISQ